MKMSECCSGNLINDRCMSCGEMSSPIISDEESNAMGEDYMETFLRVRGFTPCQIHEAGIENLYRVYNALLNRQYV